MNFACAAWPTRLRVTIVTVIVAVVGVTDHPGTWERRGYHNYGDPWRQHRFRGH